MTVDQCHNLPLHLCPQPVFRCNTKNYASGSAEIFTQGIYRSPSGVLTTKPHDSAGAHRRACARIADSVCVINRDLLRKFINEKETAKISHHARISHPRMHLLHLSLRISVVGLSTHPPPQDRYTRIHLPGNPHTGVRQHDATRKTAPRPSPSVLPAQNEAVMAVSSDICSTTQRSLSSCSGSASGLPATKFTASRKTGIHPAADHRGPHQALQVLRHPGDQTKQIGHRQRTVWHCCPSRSSQSHCRQSGMPDIAAPAR